VIAGFGRQDDPSGCPVTVYGDGTATRADYVFTSDGTWADGIVACRFRRPCRTVVNYTSARADRPQSLKCTA